MGEVARAKAEIEKNLKEMLADKLIEPKMLDTAKLLLYAIMFGCKNIDDLAWRSGLSRDRFVRPLARRLREAGIWLEDGTVGFETLNDPDSGHMNIEFILHCLVAEGWVRRSVGPTAPDSSEAGRAKVHEFIDRLVNPQDSTNVAPVEHEVPAGGSRV